MQTPTCAKCAAAIGPEDINVARDIAYCRSCNLTHKLSALVQMAEIEAGVDLRNPPPGCSQERDGLGTTIIASHRNLLGSLGALGATLFWNGIVSVFVLVATSSTLSLMGIPVPEWFPDPTTDSGPMGTGVTIFLWLFLTPFIVIGLVLLGSVLMMISGRTEVRVGRNEGVVFTGVGPLGYRRRFDPQNVKSVGIDEQNWRDGDGDRRHKSYIVIEANDGKQVKFGTMLKAERRKFVAAALRRLVPAGK